MPPVRILTNSSARAGNAPSIATASTPINRPTPLPSIFETSQRAGAPPAFAALFHAGGAHLNLAFRTAVGGRPLALLWSRSISLAGGAPRGPVAVLQGGGSGQRIQ
ncbi:hypothetical protein GCM10010994_51850 [Chelatococcus reniformis]|uniref:Uncharacterized protein n=1 Tax=Chelatococcus reniformis TaxID=1494448 RepID=A0A916XMQ0_9HYPH|nr:hypothetical protein GCM10010994_51850 [Chelatococcus reniformis]